MSTPNISNKINSNKIKDAALREARSVAPKYCEKCGERYSDENFHLVQKNDKQSVFHLKCSRCNNTYILNVVSPSPNVMASQRSSLNIDLRGPEEVEKFAGKDAVDQDEALDILNSLKKQDIEKILKS